MMDQERIGKFIAELRKKKKMTQNDLAIKLGVTDRAISKWENGRGLPDISLIKPLCEELGISINELLNGEKIKKDEYEKKFEENIIKTMTDSKKNIRKANILSYLIIGIIIVVTVFLTIFFIDMNRIKNGEKVFFSTWGFDYVIPVSIDEELVSSVIDNYFVNEGFSEWNHPHEHPFISTKIYLIEENKIKEEYYVYCWVVGFNYYLEDNIIKEDSSFSIPYKFVLVEGNETFYIKDVVWPRDQPFYEEDMKKIFPASVRKEMDKLYHNDSYDDMKDEIDAQVKKYYFETVTS